VIGGLACEVPNCRREKQQQLAEQHCALCRPIRIHGSVTASQWQQLTHALSSCSGLQQQCWLCADQSCCHQGSHICCCCCLHAGVMDAAMKGARSSSSSREGDTIAIMPGEDAAAASIHADIVICTGLGSYRNGGWRAQ
jgi:hypothetical protein